MWEWSDLVLLDFILHPVLYTHATHYKLNAVLFVNTFSPSMSTHIDFPAPSNLYSMFSSLHPHLICQVTLPAPLLKSSKAAACRNCFPAFWNGMVVLTHAYWVHCSEIWASGGLWNVNFCYFTLALNLTFIIYYIVCTALKVFLP